MNTVCPQMKFQIGILRLKNFTVQRNVFFIKMHHLNLSHKKTDSPKRWHTAIAAIVQILVFASKTFTIGLFENDCR